MSHLENIKISCYSANPENTIYMGVYGYSHSTNLGDYMQTLAQINLLSYFYNSKWDINSNSLRKALEFFSQNKKSSNYLFQTQPKNVKVIWIDRDLLSLYDCDQPIYLIANGWYMHRFNLDKKNTIKWPPADCFRPLFVSFHCQNLEILDSTKSIDYFKKYSPIGCRDQATVNILRNYGISAYFTGCLTSTLENPIEVTEKNYEYFVDLPKNSSYKNNLTHTYINNNFSFIEEKFDHYLEKTLELFNKYRQSYKVKTSRLHAYIPCKAIGVSDVELIVPNKNISRFEGLIDSFDSDKFKADAESLKNRVLNSLSSVINFNDSQPFNRHPIKGDISLKDKKFNDKLNILICFDNAFIDIVPTMLKSICLSNPHLLLYIHCFTRNVSDQNITDIKKQLEWFDNIIIKKYNMIYKFPHYKNHLGHVSVSTMDRLLVSELISDKSINRVVYLDLDLLVVDKLDELLKIDTGSTGIAARNSIDKEVVKSWIKRHPDTTPDYTESYNHSDGFNAGVIVMDLDKLRSNSFTAKTHAYYSKVGFNDQIILNLYCQNKHSILPDKYNTYIGREKENTPAILHFVGSKKPWNQDSDYSIKWEYYKNNRYLNEQYNNDYKFNYASFNNILNNQSSNLSNTFTNVMYIFVTHKAKLQESQDRISKMMAEINNENYIIVYGGEHILFDKHNKILCIKADDSYAGLPEKINKLFTYIKYHPDFNSFSHFAKLDEDIIIKNCIKNLYDIDYAGFVQSLLFNKKYHLNRCPNSIWNHTEYTGRVVPFCRGGYGYVVSKKAINKIFPNNDYLQHIYEDLSIALSLYDKGIYPVNINIQDFFVSQDHKQINSNKKVVLPI